MNSMLCMAGGIILLTSYILISPSREHGRQAKLAFEKNFPKIPFVWARRFILIAALFNLLLCFLFALTLGLKQ
jgi:hypothetical protein